MKHFPARFPAAHDLNDPDHEFLVRLIPFVGPGAAVLFLFLVKQKRPLGAAS